MSLDRQQPEATQIRGALSLLLVLGFILGMNGLSYVILGAAPPLCDKWYSSNFICVTKPVDDSADAKSYARTITPILQSMSDAQDQWTAWSSRTANVDASKLTRAQAVTEAQKGQQLAGLLHSAATDATDRFQKLVPPPDCLALHTKLLEAFQYIEQGSIEEKGYLDAALGSGRVDDAQRLRGNDLLAKADRAKVEAQPLLAKCQ